MSDKQNLPLSTVKQMLQQQRDDFAVLINSLMTSFNERHDKLFATVIEMRVSLEFSQKEIDSIKQTMVNNVQKEAALSKEVAIVNDNLNDFSNKLDYIENQSRRNNVVFDGIPEENKETWQDCETKVLNILKDKMGLSNYFPIERAHRIGYPKPQKTRPVVVKFMSYKDREMVLYNAKKLKGTPVYVREDLSEKVLAERRSQLNLLKEARENGKIAYFSYNRLIIKERSHDSSLSDERPDRRTTRSQSGLKA